MGKMNNPARLDADGRVIMISGANRGIGAAIATCLYRQGYSLGLGVREPSSAADVTAGMAPERFQVHRYDAAERDAAEHWTAAVLAQFGRLDGAVNNAGIARPFDFDTPDEDALDEMFNINAKAPYRLMRAIRPHLKAAENGRIVVITSLAGTRSKGGSFGYAMSKHAAQALAHAARNAFWDDGIRVSIVAPGPVETDMTRGRRLANLEDAEMTRAETIADAVALLLSLPKTASVSMLPVNAVTEPLL
jgi:NAD(P)-dependent dehydrogenase (short-subunit alcohol dehydrogenase family)